MFDFVKHNKWAARIILTIMVVPFLFFGVDWLRSSGISDVAVVNGEGISAAEYDSILRDMRDQARNNGNQNPYSTPESRVTLLYQIINDKLLLHKAQEERFQTLGDAELQKLIGGIPEFQENGVFSAERYRQVLQSIGESPIGFQQRLQRARMQQPVVTPITEGEFALKATTSQYVRLMTEQRKVRMVNFAATDYQQHVAVTDAQIAAYYNEHKEQYTAPESVALEYLILSRDQVLRSIKVSDEQVRDEYQHNLQRYMVPETRTVAHILIDVAKDATPEQRTKAREEAEAILKQVEAKPASFAEEAKKFSKDPASAPAGGELGKISRGMFVKPFEDAVFGVSQSGIIPQVIATDFGYHIIKVNITPARQLTLDEAKAQVTDDLKHRLASEDFAKRAELMKNKVFEISDSFDETAKELGITVSKANYLTRAQVAQLAGGDQRFADAVFAPESISDKQNTEALDLSNNGLISARVTDYKPAAQRDLNDVAPGIRELLQKRAALELAVKDGEAKLTELKAGRRIDGMRFGEAVEVGRLEGHPGVPTAIVQALFQAPADKLPTFFGAAVSDSRYTIFRLESITPGMNLSAAQLVEAENEMRAVRGSELFQAYVLQLRKEAKIEVFEERLEKLQ